MNSLLHLVDLTSLTSFKRTIINVDYPDFLKVFHSNFINQYLMFILVLSHCTVLLFIWAAVSTVADFLTLGTQVFIVHMLCFLYFLTLWLCCVS